MVEAVPLCIELELATGAAIEVLPQDEAVGIETTDELLPLWQDGAQYIGVQEAGHGQQQLELLGAKQPAMT